MHEGEVSSVASNLFSGNDGSHSPPKGFQVKGKEHMIYKLRKALHDLEQAPITWYLKLDKSLQSLGLTRSGYELVVYFKRLTNSHLCVGIYVDDVLIT